MGLRFLYKIKSNPTYTESLFTIYEREDHEYNDNRKNTRQKNHVS